MLVDVTPRHAEVVPGSAVPIAITITNTASIIAGYTIRVLGADPGWVDLPAGQLSLFPDESTTLTATVTPPRGIAAGPRRIAVQVRELTPPHDSRIQEVDLTVPAAAALQMRVDPAVVTAAHRGTFSLLVENTGNTVIAGYPAGDDPTGKVRFRFRPDGVTLAPGEHALIDMEATARRHLLGSPVVRPLSLYLDPPAAERFFDGGDATPPPRDEQAAPATATLVQRAVLSRGPVALLGLLAAVTVFAIVLTSALSRLVNQSTADRDLALQVAAAQSAGGGGGSSSIAGTVRLLSKSIPQDNVTVSLFDAADTNTPITTTVTDAAGHYEIDNLAAGKYKLSYGGAGFVELWYPGATAPADSGTVNLKADTPLSGLDVSIGGVPATIKGTVVGTDVSAATLYLETAGGRSGAPVEGVTAPSVGGAVPPPDNGDAVVQSEPVGSDGSFVLAGVPSPAQYDLVVTKAGYATTVQRIDVGAGETRSGVTLTLRQGDGLIAGTVTSADGPLSDVTVSATNGQSTATSVSLTGTGAFTLRALPSPATLTVVAGKPGFATQTQTLRLAAGQKLTGVVITLSRSAGSLSGNVAVRTPGDPAGGVAVTVTDGTTTIATGTQSQPIGATKVGDWRVDGLPIPGTYTVTFTRTDLESQTVAVTLDANGKVSEGSSGVTVTDTGFIKVIMVPATAKLYGTVSQRDADTGKQTPVGEVTVTVSSGTSSYTVVSASVPRSKVGWYELDAIPAGTWTISANFGGTAPTSTIRTFAAGDTVHLPLVLQPPASLTGTVLGTDGRTARRGWVVQLYEAASYPDVIAESTTTDGRGRFEFPAVDAPQVYVIVVRPSAASAQAASQTLEIDPSKHPDITLEADPDG
jgi:hypothetical protein